MKFITFIASTMLIVLISQHSIMGLPINDTIVEESCSKGFEMVNGQCIPIESMTTTVEIETSSHISENLIAHEEEPVTVLNTPKIVGACPEGMKHGKNGICEEIEPSPTTEVIIESTTDLNEQEGGVKNIKGCPKGTAPDEEGACQTIKLFKPTKKITNAKSFKKDRSCPDNYKMVDGQCVPMDSMTTTIEIETSSHLSENIIAHEEQPVPVLNTPKNLGACPEGMKHGKNGICEEIEPSTTTEVIIESTTALNEHEGGVKNIKGCPKGTAPDEEGACQTIKLFKPTKKITNAKSFKKDRSCPDNYKMVDGQCMPMDSMTTTIEIETSSHLPENIITHEEEPVPVLNTPKNLGACPEGMKHGKNGICEEIEPSTTTEVIIESTTDLNEDEGGVKNIKGCPKGTAPDEEGACQTIKLFKPKKKIANPKSLKKDRSCPDNYKMVDGQCMPLVFMTTNVEIETSSHISENLITHEEEPVPVLNTPKIVGACPEGMKHGKNAICEKIEPSTATKIIELTTDLNEHEGGVENIKGCPEGTEPDEEGSCQETKPFKPTKKITDPKSLLKKDGSCPDNYKMVDSQCLYIKPKTNSTLYPSGSSSDDSVSNGIRPKSSIDEGSKIELVPVLADNSCPEGTEYSEYGLCQKRILLSNSKLHMKADGSCPDEFELINGKCSYKNVKISSQVGLSTSTTVNVPVNTTPDKELFNNNKLVKSTTTVGEPVDELQVTSSPF